MRCEHQELLQRNAQNALNLIIREQVGHWISDRCTVCGEEIWITYVNEVTFSFMVAAVRRQGEGTEVIDPIFLSERQMSALAQVHTSG
ncbi:MAG: hypothetical protein KatS3mg057_1302 [Herpetosiphonaceae bacterium]|nr:MAG: hypothetical protein KatS3mg057_1302 [Herpetosiphonaceae bacterium]